MTPLETWALVAFFVVLGVAFIAALRAVVLADAELRAFDEALDAIGDAAARSMQEACPWDG